MILKFCPVLTQNVYGNNLRIKLWSSIKPPKYNVMSATVRRTRTAMVFTYLMYKLTKLKKFCRNLATML